MGNLYRYFNHLLLYNIHHNLPLSMKNSILLWSCIFEPIVSIHMHVWFQKIMKCTTHLCMHTSLTQNLWLWPKRPPSAFSVAETSVAEMSRPKRPRPKCPWPKCPSTDTSAWLYIHLINSRSFVYANKSACYDNDYSRSGVYCFKSACSDEHFFQYTCKSHSVV